MNCTLNMKLQYLRINVQTCYNGRFYYKQKLRELVFISFKESIS